MPPIQNSKQKSFKISLNVHIDGILFEGREGDRTKLLTIFDVYVSLPLSGYVLFG